MRERGVRWTKMRNVVVKLKDQIDTSSIVARLIVERIGIGHLGAPSREYSVIIKQENLLTCESLV